jgi:hypothetical protein
VVWVAHRKDYCFRVVRQWRRLRVCGVIVKGCLDGWAKDSLTVVATDGVESVGTVLNLGMRKVRDPDQTFLLHLTIVSSLHLRLESEWLSLRLRSCLSWYSRLKHAYKLGPYFRPRRKSAARVMTSPCIQPLSISESLSSYRIASPIHLRRQLAAVLDERLHHLPSRTFATAGAAAHH